jgi:hypothetical protein
MLGDNEKEIIGLSWAVEDTVKNYNMVVTTKEILANCDSGCDATIFFVDFQSKNINSVCKASDIEQDLSKINSDLNKCKNDEVA